MGCVPPPLSPERPFFTTIRKDPNPEEGVMRRGAKGVSYRPAGMGGEKGYWLGKGEWPTPPPNLLPPIKPF